MIIAGSVPTKNVFEVPPPTTSGDPLRGRRIWPGGGELLSDELVEKFGADRSALYQIDGTEHYFSDKKHIFWVFPKIRIVEGADASTFEIMDGWRGVVARDKNFIYASGIAQPQLDRNTFVRVESTGPQHSDGSYFKDSRHVYASSVDGSHGDYLLNFKIIESADPANFKILGFNGDLTSSHDFLYWNGVKIEGLSASGFKGMPSWYMVFDTGTYYLDRVAANATGRRMIKPILLSTSTDPAPFIKRCNDNECYLRIGNQIFYGTSTIDGANADLFVVPCGDDCSSGYSPYAFDNRSVYYKGVKILGSVGRGFKQIEVKLAFPKDPGADRQSNYVSDDAGIYFSGLRVLGASKNTFTVIKSGEYIFEYAKDDKGVYFHEKKIEGADPKTFEPYDGQQPYEGCRAGNYAHDGRTVYYKDQLVPDANPKTFEPVFGGGYYGRDGEQYYEGVKKIKKEEVKECNYG